MSGWPASKAEFVPHIGHRASDEKTTLTLGIAV